MVNIGDSPQCLLDRELPGDGKLPYPDGAFAGAHVDATEHSDVEKRLREAVRVVRTGGAVHIRATGPMRGIVESWTAHNISHLALVEEDGPDWLLTVGDRRQMKASDEDCVFCDSLRFRMNHVAGLPGAAGVLWADADLFVMPDLAPTVRGHLLIVTTEHHPSLARAGEPLTDAVRSAKQRVREAIERGYGCDTVFFEHGPAQPSGGGSCVDHAHVHCIPAAEVGDMVAVCDDVFGPGQAIAADRLSEMRGRSYIYVEHNERTRAYLESATTSQVLRKLVLRAVGDDGPYRWQERFAAEDNVTRFQETLDTLLPSFGR